MGFGHRVYKSYDPRAKLIKTVADQVFEQTGLNPKLEIALELERIALEDEYFVSRKLYPNVDFYSGLIYQAMGYPTDYFTVLFALGRLPGWIAQWEEMLNDPEQKISRPRQIVHRLRRARLRADRRPLDRSGSGGQRSAASDARAPVEQAGDRDALVGGRVRREPADRLLELTRPPDLVAARLLVGRDGDVHEALVEVALGRLARRARDPRAARAPRTRCPLRTSSSASAMVAVSAIRRG